MNISKCLLFLGLCFSLNLHAQKGKEFGGWVGIANYFGDLNTRLNVTQPGLAFGLNARRNFNTRTAIKTSLSFARVRANDDASSLAYERLRNLDFYSNIYDLTTTGEFNFFEYSHGSKIDYWTPYLSVGFSVFKFNPRTNFQGESVRLQPLGTEGQDIGEEYLTINGGITIGLGMKWDINREISLNAEFTVRRIFTDYLDDVSTVYPNFNSLAQRRSQTAVLLSNRAGNFDQFQPGDQRGNSRNNDTYTLFGLSIMKYIGEIPCPKLTR